MTKTINSPPLRGEIWWINFDPSVGGKIQKTRPAVIISNDVANKMLNRLQVVPISINASALYPVECYVMVQGKQGKAMADQLTTISKLRLISRIGMVAPAELEAIGRIILLQLGM